jgi:hypothetical protein
MRRARLRLQQRLAGGQGGGEASRRLHLVEGHRDDGASTSPRLRSSKRWCVEVVASG